MREELAYLPFKLSIQHSLWEGISCHALHLGISCHALHLVSSAASNYRHFVETHIDLGGWGCSSVVVCLPSKLKPLGSIPSTAPPPKKTYQTKIDITGINDTMFWICFWDLLAYSCMYFLRVLRQLALTCLSREPHHTYNLWIKRFKLFIEFPKTMRY